MNFAPTKTPRVTADFEYDERRFESEANSDYSIPNLLPDLGEFVPNPLKVAESGGAFLADAGAAIAELFTGDIMAKPESNKPQIGGQTELRFNQEQKQVQENQRVITQQKVTVMEQAEVRSEEAQKRARAQQIEQINKTIGIKNASYEGTVNENGEMRIDVQTYYEQANSALSEQEVKAQRQNQVAKGSGQAAMGENELLKGGENFGHFTKATG